VKATKMILKIIFSKEDDCEEVFQITNYYTESRTYLEADIYGINEGEEDENNREIVLQHGNYLDESSIWDEIIILTDKGEELLKFENIQATQTQPPINDPLIGEAELA